MRQHFRYKSALSVFILLLSLLLTACAAFRQPQNVNPSKTPMPRISKAQPGSGSTDYSALKRNIADYVKGQPATYGIYFKDLANGGSFGINENQPIKAASTNKLLTVLYLNEQVVSGKLNWQDKITFNKDIHLNPQGGIMQTEAVDGAKYSLRVLSNLSITLSDNTAHTMLLKYLGLDNIADYMRRIGGQTVYPDGQNITTARDMGRYLEYLWDFAKRHPSEGGRLLDDLSYTIWDFGLPGKLPESVRVAHKEGLLYSGVSNDVGIVFSPRPYILVVLSEGQPDADGGFNYIAEISRRVYDFQAKR